MGIGEPLLICWWLSGLKGSKSSGPRTSLRSKRNGLVMVNAVCPKVQKHRDDKI